MALVSPGDLLKLRGPHEDRFIILPVEAYLSGNREEMLRDSLSEDEVRHEWKSMGLADSDIEERITACLRRPYLDFTEPEKK